MLTQATATRLPYRDESIHACFCSPPYWGLRIYPNLPPQVWGGDPGCEHVWDVFTHDPNPHGNDGMTNSGLQGGKASQNQTRMETIESATCARCGAWRGHLGNEPELGLFVSNLVAVGREVRRVLRADGTWLLNLGDSFGRNGGETGGGIRDYLHLEGIQKRMISVPAWETYKPKDKLLIPHRVALALQEDGWWVRSDVPWLKVNSLSESVRDRPTVAHEYVFLLSKGKRYYWDRWAVARPSAESSRQRISQQNFASRTGGAKDYGTSGVNRNSSARKALEGFVDGGGSVRQYRTTDAWADSLDEAIDSLRDLLFWLEAHRDGEPLALDGDGLPLGVRTPVGNYGGDHFAAFPERLVVDLLRAAGGLGGCCPRCGKRWERDMEKQLTGRGNTSRTNDDGYVNGKSTARSMAEKRQAYREIGMEGLPPPSFKGWRPACDCGLDETVPPVILDPFVGTGTVSLVCRELGYDFVGADLSAEYLAGHAAPRTGGRTTALALRLESEKITKKYHDCDGAQKTPEGQLILFSDSERSESKGE